MIKEVAVTLAAWAESSILRHLCPLYARPFRIPGQLVIAPGINKTGPWEGLHAHFSQEGFILLCGNFDCYYILVCLAFKLPLVMFNIDYLAMAAPSQGLCFSPCRK